MNFIIDCFLKNSSVKKFKGLDNFFLIARMIPTFQQTTCSWLYFLPCGLSSKSVELYDLLDAMMAEVTRVFADERLHCSV